MTTDSNVQPIRLGIATPLRAAAAPLPIFHRTEERDRPLPGIAAPLPCPFCAYPGSVEIVGDFACTPTQWSAYCHSCNCCGPRANSLEDAANDWNRRGDPELMLESASASDEFDLRRAIELIDLATKKAATSDATAPELRRVVPRLLRQARACLTGAPFGPNDAPTGGGGAAPASEPLAQPDEPASTAATAEEFDRQNEACGQLCAARAIADMISVARREELFDDTISWAASHVADLIGQVHESLERSPQTGVEARS